MSAEVERLVAGSREEWDDGADDKWLWGEQNHRASARLDHSVTQSCPGSTSLPDGCLLRMCKENRRSRCSVFVSVCVCVWSCCPSHVAPHRQCVVALAAHSLKAGENLNLL